MEPRSAGRVGFGKRDGKVKLTERLKVGKEINVVTMNEEYQGILTSIGVDFIEVDNDYVFPMAGIQLILLIDEKV